MLLRICSVPDSNQKHTLGEHAVQQALPIEETAQTGGAAVPTDIKGAAHPDDATSVQQPQVTTNGVTPLLFHSGCT